jgi:hypothetical protein
VPVIEVTPVAVPVADVTPVPVNGVPGVALVEPN